MDNKLLFCDFVKEFESLILAFVVEIDVALVDLFPCIGEPQIELAVIVRITDLLDKSLSPELSYDL